MRVNYRDSLIEYSGQISEEIRQGRIVEIVYYGHLKAYVVPKDLTGLTLREGAELGAVHQIRVRDFGIIELGPEWKRRRNARQMKEMAPDQIEAFLAENAKGYPIPLSMRSGTGPGSGRAHRAWLVPANTYWMWRLGL